MAPASIMTRSLPPVSPLRSSLRLSPARRPAPPVVLSVFGLLLQGGRHNMTDTSGEAEPLGAKTLALHSISAIAFPCL